MRYQQSIVCFCDGCPSQSTATLRVVSMGQGEVTDVQPPKGWTSAVVESPGLALLRREALKNAWLPAAELSSASGAPIPALFCAACSASRARPKIG